MKKSVVLSFLLLASSVNAINVDLNKIGTNLDCRNTKNGSLCKSHLRNTDYNATTVCSHFTTVNDYNFFNVAIGGEQLRENLAGIIPDSAKGIGYFDNKPFVKTSNTNAVFDRNAYHQQILKALEGSFPKNNHNNISAYDGIPLAITKTNETIPNLLVTDRYVDYDIDSTGQLVVENIGESPAHVYMNTLFGFNKPNNSFIGGFKYLRYAYGTYREDALYRNEDKVQFDFAMQNRDFLETAVFQNYANRPYSIGGLINTLQDASSRCITIDFENLYKDENIGLIIDKLYKFDYKPIKTRSALVDLNPGEHKLYSIHKYVKNGVFMGPKVRDSQFNIIKSNNIEVHVKPILQDKVYLKDLYTENVGLKVSYLPDADEVLFVLDSNKDDEKLKFKVYPMNNGNFMSANDRMIKGQVQEIAKDPNEAVLIIDRFTKGGYKDSIAIKPSYFSEMKQLGKVIKPDDENFTLQDAYGVEYTLDLKNKVYCEGVNELAIQFNSMSVKHNGYYRPIFQAGNRKDINNETVVISEKDLLTSSGIIYVEPKTKSIASHDVFMYGFKIKDGNVNNNKCESFTGGNNNKEDNNNTEVEQKPSDKVTTISTVWTSDTDSTCPVDDTNKALNLVYSRTSNQNVCVKVDIGSDFVGSTPKAKLIDLNTKQAVKSLDIPINGIVDFGKLSSSVYQIEVSNGTKSVKSNNFAVITTSPIAKDLSTTAGNDLKISINDLLSSNPFNSSKLQNITMNIDSYKFTRDYSKDNVYNIRFPLATSGKYQALIKVDDSRLENKNICLDKVYTNANFFENGLSTCYSKTREANISFTSDDVANASTSIQKSLNDKYVLMDNSLLDYVELNTKVSNPVIKKYNDALKLTYNLKFENNNDSYFKDRLRLGDEAIGGYSQGNVLYTDVVATKAELDKIYNDELSRLSRLTAWYSENPKPLNKTSKLKIAYLKTIKKPFSEVTSSSSGSIFIDHPELPEFYLDTKSSTVALNTGATNSIGSDKIPFIYLDILVEDKDLDFTNNVIKADEFVMYKLDKSGKTETVNDSIYKKEALKKLFENTITHYGTKFRYDEMSGNISVDLEASQKNKNNVREIAYVLKSSPFAPNKNYRIDFYKPQSYEKAKEFYDSNSTHRYGDKKKYKPENKEQYDNKSRKRD